MLQNNYTADPTQGVNQATLAAVQKYDPNAQYVNIAGNDDSTPMYQLQYDASKLPGASGSGSLGPAGGSWSPLFSYAGGKVQTVNPNLVVNSPIYGKITPNENIKQDDSGFMGFLDKVLPYAVMGTLGWGAGLAGTSLLGGMGLGGATGSALGKTLGNVGLQEIMSGGQAKLNPLSLAGDLVGAIPGVGSIAQSSGLSQIMPYLNLAQNIYGATKGNPNSMINLGKYGYNALSGLGGH
jgi:hypothetical protein